MAEGTMFASEASHALALRRRMVADLAGKGVLSDPALAAAFAAVPREVFLPSGVPVAAVYQTHRALETGQDEYGRAASVTARTSTPGAPCWARRSICWPGSGRAR